ncbi:MAG: protein kinase, partial [Gemmatimonadetes bacterium]|nr:protein kinase [Gemmatimonadota bacterium]
MTDPAAQPPTPGDPLLGTVLAGRYRIVGHLGEGAMGSVYLGEHLKIGRRDAIKILRRSLASDEEAIARFIRGATNASRVHHPNVCSIYDCGETEDGLVFLAMELIEGESLQELLARQQSLPLSECAVIARQVADALQAAHDAGIVHRDLKPGNIMLARGRGRAPIVKVVDFDIAKGSSEGEPSDLTQMGFVIGTPEYMSPEQLTADGLDGRSDVYSLGMVLFRMLSGALPFPSKTSREAMVQRLTQEPRTLQTVLPDVVFPAAVQAVLDRALARDPENRYPSAQAFGDDLIEAVRSVPRAGASAAPSDAYSEPAGAAAAAGPPSLDPTAPPPSTTSDPVRPPDVPRDESPEIPKTEMHWGRRTRPKKRPVRALALVGVAVVAAGIGGWAMFGRGGAEGAILDLLPPTATLRAGEEVRFNATLANAPGGEAEGEQVEWSSSDLAVASVDASGRVTGVGPGNASIVARLGDLQATAQVSVSAGASVAARDPSSPSPSDAAPREPTRTTSPTPTQGAPARRLTLDVTDVAFVSVDGGPAPADRSVRVDTNGGGDGALSARVNYGAGAVSGWLQTVVASGGAPPSVRLRVDPTGVPLGRHAARVEVTAPGASAAWISVAYEKSPAATETTAAPPDPAPAPSFRPEDSQSALDRQVNRLLDGPGGAALESVRDTAGLIWELDGVSSAVRAQAAFVMAQAEIAGGRPEAALVWAERAV